MEHTCNRLEAAIDTAKRNQAFPFVSLEVQMIPNGQFNSRQSKDKDMYFQIQNPEHKREYQYHNII